jgi:hypothetical protein
MWGITRNVLTQVSILEPKLGATERDIKAYSLGIDLSLALSEKDGVIYFSIRSKRCHAGELARLLAGSGEGGGHERMGG